MNARIAAQMSKQITNNLLENAKEMAQRLGISINDAIDKKVSIYEKYATSGLEAAAWRIRGENAKKIMI